MKKKLTAKVEHFTTTLHFADIEMKHYAGSYLDDFSGRLLDMNKIDECYLRILIENGRNANGLNDNYKKHLKTTFICEYFLVTCYY